MTRQIHPIYPILLPILLSLGSIALGQGNVYVNLPEMSALPENSVGASVSLDEQWGDYYDACVGGGYIVMNASGDLAAPTIDQREELYSQLAAELIPVRNVPNSFTQVDLLWNSVEPEGEGLFTFERGNFDKRLVLRQLDSQAIGLLGFPPPDWVEPMTYDAAAGVTFRDYMATMQDSEDGIRRSGEDRMDAWERYVAAIVAAHRDHIEIWQVLNEPNSFMFSEERLQASGMALPNALANLARFGELFDEFVLELVVRASRVIRELDPTAKISALGLLDANQTDPYSQSAILLTRLMQRGLANHVDFVSLHSFIQQWPTDAEAAVDLDHYTAPDAAMEFAKGANLRFMYDEWGHKTNLLYEEQLMPSFMLRFLAQNLAMGVSPVLFFEAYDYYIFPRDLALVRDNYILKTRYPSPPEETPGYTVYPRLVRFLSGAVSEDAVNASAPRSTGSQYPSEYMSIGHSYRSFVNGLDRIVLYWSNTSMTTNPIFTFPSASYAELLVIRQDGSLEEYESSAPMAEINLSGNGIEPLNRFESVVLYLSPNPQAAITISGPANPIVTRVPAQFEAEGPNGETLAPVWRIEQGTGLAVISQEGLFNGIRGGTCTLYADVGIHHASREIEILDLSENILVNAGMDVIWSGTAGVVASPWMQTPPSDQSIAAGASVAIVTGEEAFLGNGMICLDYPPTIAVGQDSALTTTWFPGTMTNNVVSGLNALGERPYATNEPLLFFCWARKTQGAGSDRYIYIHLAMFDRYRNPQKDHKLADVRVGGRFSPGTQWQRVSSLEQLGAPYVATGYSASDFVQNGLIHFPDAVEMFDMIFEIDNRFEANPTTAEIDSAYLGPYKPLILVHPQLPSDRIELAWFADDRLYINLTVALYLDTDLIPDKGNEYLLAQGLSAKCPQPFQIPVSDLPDSWQKVDPLFIYGVSSQGGEVIGTDYAGPIPLDRTNIQPGISEWSLY
ncbi:MAG TPA: hypothetical protein PLZ55_01045 [bacterium]|nr:hypothetical protein [bacterium]